MEYYYRFHASITAIFDSAVAHPGASEAIKAASAQFQNTYRSSVMETTSLERFKGDAPALEDLRNRVEPLLGRERRSFNDAVHYWGVYLSCLQALYRDENSCKVRPNFPHCVDCPGSRCTPAYGVRNPPIPSLLRHKR